MKRAGCVCAWAVLLVIGSSARADWKPAKGPLMTRWAAKVSPANARPEYPRPQMVRKDWMNLNGLWQMAFAEEGQAPPIGKTLPEEILVPFPVESALSGVMKHAERLWYRRTFEVPAGWAGRRVLLHFGAVDWEATVYVNGKKMGTHRGGYDGFDFDITGALKPSGRQEIVVGVFDPTDAGEQPRGKQVRKPHGIFYTPTTGIWQTVWLEPVPKEAWIEDLEIVPDVDAGVARLKVRAAGVATGDRIEAAVMAGQARVATAAGPAKKELEIPLRRPHLWSPGDPFLYDLEISLKKRSRGVLGQRYETVDEVGSYFGMRKIALGKDKNGITRMMLNDKPLFEIGFLDQGFWPDGLYTAPTDEALRYDIEVTRKLGMNLARKHVKIEPDRWYYWCDKLGLLVWQDMPSGRNKSDEAKKQFEHELRRLIEGRRNHPSIIMWVIFNEGWGQHDTARYVSMVKQLDPSRLVDNASGWSDKNVGDVHDIHKYPGPAAVTPEPTRASVLGEFGGLGLRVDGHTWADKSWGYRGMADREDLTRRYVSLLRRVWAFQESPGLSAAVYTQTTDVETECNGLMTYDRGIIKVDVAKVAAANRGRIPRLITIVPTADQEALMWQYTFEKPAGDWFKPDFDDSDWKKGRAGFGTKGTPGGRVRTEWKTSDIWLRREFVLPEGNTRGLSLLVHHDEDVEIYINGVLAAKAGGFTTSYEEMSLRAEALKALKPGGKNVLAVHCKQTGGGQYIDVGIVKSEDLPVKE